VNKYWPFADPSRADGTEEERLAVFRRVRDRSRPDWRSGSTNRKEGRGWGPLPAPSPGARLLPYSSAYHGVVEIGARQSGNVWRIRFGSFARCSPRRCSISSVGL